MLTQWCVVIRKAIFHYGVILLCSLTSFVALALDIKADAPLEYVVKKNDTLWDIAGKYLEKPWLWPELWRNNSNLQNPHLIYPGDILRIRFINAQPVLEITRDKKKRVLLPNQKTAKKPQPIDTLPWLTLAPYMLEHQIMSAQEYHALPQVLGDHRGYIQFVSDDLILSQSHNSSNEQYTLLRQRHTIKDSNGDILGIQVSQIATAKIVEGGLDAQWLLEVESSVEEAQRGDRLIPTKTMESEDMVLSPAQQQRGQIVGNLQDRMLVGNHDVVIINLGADQIQPGTVMGIYIQGPAIVDGTPPRYEFESNPARSLFAEGEPVQQPALKMGELVVIKTFEKASYGLIMRARDLVKTGAIVAHP